MGLIKKIIFIFSIYNSSAFANDAIVLVLQAPLLKEPQMNSTVLQYVRKGERVYVPNQIAALRELPEFIETFDKAGNLAYVPSRYLKIFTNDSKESLQSISKYNEYDPTDYRLEEPIPSTYPFSNYSFLKASFSLTLGNNVKSPYPYPKNFTNQEFNAEKGARVLITRRVSFDNYDRFYYGLIMNISSVRNYFEFSGGDVSTENRSLLKFGPYISFDSFKSENLRFTLGTGFTYNYHKASISYSSSDGSAEERLFSAFSLSPFVSAYAQIEKVIPAIDIIIGTDLTFYLNRNLKATSPAEFSYWPSDTIQEEMKPQANLYLGIQAKY
jgi:hypothetical protein